MSESVSNITSSAPEAVELTPPVVTRRHSPLAWTSLLLLIALFVAGWMFLPPFQGSAKEIETPAWALMLGRLHPVAVHLPVGVLFLVAFMEIFVVFRGRNEGEALRAGQTFALGFGVFGAVMAVLFGLARAREGSFSSPTFQAHELLGVATAISALITFFFKIIADGTGRLTWIYRFALLICLAMVGLTGHFGGNLIYGPNYQLKHAPKEVRDSVKYFEDLLLTRFEKKTEPAVAKIETNDNPDNAVDTHIDEPKSAPKLASAPQPTAPAFIKNTSAEVGGNGATPVSMQVAAKADGKTGGTVYSELIAPLLEEKCNSCHNDDKSKGELRLDTYEMIIVGGGSGDNVVPGKPEESLMVQRMKLPLDDDERMPPSDKPQMTEEEVELIAWWVQQGAPKDLLISDAPFPASLKSLVEKHGVKAQGGFSGNNPAALFIAVNQAAAAQAPAAPSADHASKLSEALKVINSSGAVLIPEQNTPAQLKFSAQNVAGEFNDEKLKSLEAIAEHLTVVDLSKTKITDAAIPVLAKMKNLKELNLKETAITQAAVDSLKKSNDKLVIHANWSAAPAVAKAPTPAPASKPGNADDFNNAPVFSRVILPILEAKCLSCHGEERGKGKLRMHTFADLMKGGSDGETTVIPGNVKESLMIVRAELPEDNDERMPPIDEPQLTKEELALLKWWVEQGANESVTVAAIKKTPEIEGYLQAYAKMKTAAPKPAVAEKPKPRELTVEEKKKVTEVAAKMTALSATFMPISLETPSQYRFAAVNAADKFGDKEIALLSPAGLTIVWADFARTKITDAGLAYVAGMDNLERLHLENTAITDEGLSHLSRLTKLEYLNLYGTKVTDAGLAKLANNKALKKLFVWQTSVTPQGAKKLEEAIPGLVVNVGLTEADVVKLIEAAKPKPEPEPAPATSAPKPAPKPEAAKPAAPAPKPDAKPQAQPPPQQLKPEAKPAPAKPEPAPAPATPPAPAASPAPAPQAA